MRVVIVVLLSFFVIGCATKSPQELSQTAISECTAIGNAAVQDLVDKAIFKSSIDESMKSQRFMDYAVVCMLNHKGFVNVPNASFTLQRDTSI